MVPHLCVRTITGAWSQPSTAKQMRSRSNKTRHEPDNGSRSYKDLQISSMELDPLDGRTCKNTQGYANFALNSGALNPKS